MVKCATVNKIVIVLVLIALHYVSVLFVQNWFIYGIETYHIEIQGVGGIDQMDLIV